MINLIRKGRELMKISASILTILLLCSSSSALARVDETNPPQSYFGSSAATIFDLGGCKQAEILIEGNSARALFNEMTGVEAEQETVTGPEGGFLYIRYVKRGASLTCTLDRQSYICTLNFSDRLHGRIG